MGLFYKYNLLNPNFLSANHNKYAIEENNRKKSGSILKKRALMIITLTLFLELLLPSHILGAVTPDYSHIVGSNYVYWEAVNQIQMWQEFDTIAINRDMGYAQNIGMTALRCHLHPYVYNQNPEKLLERIETFLSIAQRHKLQIILCFFDDNWYTDDRVFNFTPTAGAHNGRWAKSPFLQDRIPANYPKFKEYVQNIIKPHITDKRILAWELWNEPGAQGQDWVLIKTKEILELALTWAREVKPTQPLLTSHLAESWSEVNNPHIYGPVGAAVDKVRGTLVTEAGARAWGTDDDSFGSPIEWIYWLSTKKAQGIEVPGVFFNWELMVGNSMCRWQWSAKIGDPEPPIPWHGMFFKDGTPVSLTEIEAVRRYIKKDTQAVFFDDFQDGDFKGWTVVTGTWKINSVGNVKDLMSTVQIGENYIVAGNSIWKDFVVQATVRLMSNGEAGMLIRTKNSGTGNSTLQGYLCSFNTSTLYLKKITNGVSKILNSKPIPSGDYAVMAKIRNSLKVAIKKNTIKIFLNDPKTVDIEHTDSDSPISNGQIGFMTTNIDTRFDDITVFLDTGANAINSQYPLNTLRKNEIITSIAQTTTGYTFTFTNDEKTIKEGLPIKIAIFSVNGKIVWEHTLYSALTNRIEWKKENNQGQKLPQGVYLLKVFNKNNTPLNGKCILLHT